VGRGKKKTYGSSLKRRGNRKKLDGRVYLKQPKKNSLGLLKGKEERSRRIKQDEYLSRSLESLGQVISEDGVELRREGSSQLG